MRVQKMDGEVKNNEFPIDEKYIEDEITYIKQQISALGTYTVDEKKLKRDSFAQLLVSDDIREKVLREVKNTYDLIAAW